SPITDHVRRGGTDPPCTTSITTQFRGCQPHFRTDMIHRIFSHLLSDLFEIERPGIHDSTAQYDQRRTENIGQASQSGRQILKMPFHRLHCFPIFLPVSLHDPMSVGFRMVLSGNPAIMIDQSTDRAIHLEASPPSAAASL